MNPLQDRFKKLGLHVPSILLPTKDVDAFKWSVVACDQFTSEPEYWQDVENTVKDAPSTLELIYPECYLEDDDRKERIENIHTAMKSYLSKGFLEEQKPGFILVERTTDTGVKRYGLVLAVDLEAYDFSEGSQSLIRATEGTIIERIPPRKEVRLDAPLELPHVLLLINDPEKKIVEAITQKKDTLTKVYDTELMLKGGHLTGYAVDSEELLSQVADAVESVQAQQAELLGKNDPILFAVGDGNHSLATAKAVWEEHKKNDPSIAGTDHPARFALVELTNLYDAGIEFEPIHRAIFDFNFEEFIDDFGNEYEIEVKKTGTAEEAAEIVEKSNGEQLFAYITKEESGVVYIKNSSYKITVGSVQSYLKEFEERFPSATVDYIHGFESTKTLGMKDNAIGMLLPPIGKDQLFPTVVFDGAFPRKSFSIGEAIDKRYYFESRKITK